jgi:hypothetical protein
MKPRVTRPLFALAVVAVASSLVGGCIGSLNLEVEPTEETVVFHWDGEIHYLGVASCESAGEPNNCALCDDDGDLSVDPDDWFVGTYLGPGLALEGPLAYGEELGHNSSPEALVPGRRYAVTVQVYEDCEYSEAPSGTEDYIPSSTVCSIRRAECVEFVF